MPSTPLFQRLTANVADNDKLCEHFSDPDKQPNENHVLRKGDRRLKVTVGRTDEHYCASGARRFVKESIARLEAINRDLQAPEAGDTTSTTGPGEASV